MKLFIAMFVVMCVVAGVSANCGCLKCSKHLQSIDIPGPDGQSIRVIFERPQCQCQQSNSPINTQQKPKCSGKILAPTAPKPPARLLKNLKYKTTTVRVPPPSPPPPPPPPAPATPEPVPEQEIPAELLQFLLSLSATPEATAAAVAAVPSTCGCCSCRNKREVCECGESCSCPICQKQSLLGRRRTKRDLAEHSYNFFLNMLPQYIRAPLHDSLRGSNLLTGSKKDFRFLPKGRSKPPQPNLGTDYLRYSLLKQVPPSPKQANEATLLRKLKKLNGNPFSSNLEDQATTFMKSLIQPSLKRAKRTITIGSDEIDLPPHYEVDLVSEEEDEDEPVEYESPIVGDTSFMRNLHQRRPVLAPLFQKPEVVMRKHEIQSAVREELHNYHKKLEQEQKLKKLKEEVFRKKNVVPQNPIFRILAAPMQFLRHFHDINKGVSPVVTSLPTLVHTTKKYFRDFGKNFHKNCLNLASDIIGDFDHVSPNVIQEITSARRLKRSALTSEHSRDIDRKAEEATTSAPIDPVSSTSQLNKPSNFPQTNSITPEYTLTSPSLLPRNFPQAPEDTSRKKRYVVKVVDDSEIQDQVQNYLSEQMNGHLSYLQPLQHYYDKVSEFVTKLYSEGSDQPEQEEDQITEKPKKRRLKIRKIKPKVIIDNKGLPFLEYDGYKRPLILKPSKSAPPKDSSEESKDKIESLIARAKEGSEIVGASLKPDYMPHQIIKERISAILEEIDQLVQLNPEDFDPIFESLIKVQQIKTSIEQDWKRLIMDERIQDMKSKIGLLSKFRDLQNAKDDSVRRVAEALQQTKNSFVRKQLVHSMIRLQKLQCLISTVLDDFDQHLETKTSFNTKKEIKMVDFLSELKFVHAKTRNDLVKRLNKDREAEGHKNIELLHKLKKLLISMNADYEKFEQVAKLLWELKNLQKLQSQTIEELLRKLKKKLKVKKELKIMFDLQKRYEDCELELNELLGNQVVKATRMSEKKDVKDVIADIKRRHEEMVQKAKERRENLLKKSKL